MIFSTMYDLYVHALQCQIGTYKVDKYLYGVSAMLNRIQRSVINKIISACYLLYSKTVAKTV